MCFSLFLFHTSAQCEIPPKKRLTSPGAIYNVQISVFVHCNLTVLLLSVIVYNVCIISCFTNHGIGCDLMVISTHVLCDIMAISQHLTVNVTSNIVAVSYMAHYQD